jgi:hypothetical protein
VHLLRSFHGLMLIKVTAQQEPAEPGSGLLLMGLRQLQGAELQEVQAQLQALL